MLIRADSLFAIVDDVIDRPTADAKAVVLDHCDTVWDQLRRRLVGLDDDEYLWPPVPDVWTVRRLEGGAVVVEGCGERDQDPAPVTTIAWRMWHIAVDCLDSYAGRFLGRTGARVDGDTWHLAAADGIADLESTWSNFRGGMGDVDDDRWWSPIGPAFGPYGDHSTCDLVLHALREVTHHGAEIALLRDLYRAR